MNTCNTCNHWTGDRAKSIQQVSDHGESYEFASCPMFLRSDRIDIYVDHANVTPGYGTDCDTTGDFSCHLWRKAND